MSHSFQIPEELAYIWVEAEGFGPASSIAWQTLCTRVSKHTEEWCAVGAEFPTVQWISTTAAEPVSSEQELETHGEPSKQTCI